MARAWIFNIVSIDNWVEKHYGYYDFKQIDICELLYNIIVSYRLDIWLIFHINYTNHSIIIVDNHIFLLRIDSKLCYNSFGKVNGIIKFNRIN